MINNLTNIYEEFVDSNMDKRYPLIDTPTDAINPGDFHIPESFIADMKVCVGCQDNPGDASNRIMNNTYISNIRVYPDYIYVYISSTIGDYSGIIAESDPIPVTLNTGDSITDRTIHIRPTSDIPVNGTLVIGTCADISKYPGSWDISKGNGLIFPANIIIMPDTLNYIKVGDDIVSGDITLEAGDNVDIEYIKDTNTIRISVLSPDTAIAALEDLVAAVTDKYGAPICAINDVRPIDGNIVIAPSDCLTVETLGNTITFYNPCGNTCSSEEFMRDTYTRISDLNKNMSVLTSFYASVSNTLAQMGVRVASVLEKRTS